eukprot:1586583-Pyramimonas_sp.AAC.1
MTQRLAEQISDLRHQLAKSSPASRLKGSGAASGANLATKTTHRARPDPDRQEEEEAQGGRVCGSGR